MLFGTNLSYTLFRNFPTVDSYIPKDLKARVAQVLIEVDARVNSPERVAQRNGTIAPILLLPYPHAVRGVHGHQHCAASVNQLEKRFLKSFQEVMNTSLGHTATVIGKTRPVYFVRDVEDAFLGEDACASNTPITITNFADGSGKTVGDTVWGSSNAQQLFHPTPRGYRMEAEAIASWSQRPGLRDPQSYEPSTHSPFATETFENAQYRAIARALAVFGWVLPEDPRSVTLDCSPTQLERQRERLAPEESDDYVTYCSIVRSTKRTYFQVRSEPCSLGFYETGPDTTSLTIRLPHDLEPGDHTLIAYGLDENGKPLSGELPIYVPSQAEQNAIVLAAYGVVSLVLALLCAIPAGIIALLRRRRRRTQTASA